MIRNIGLAVVLASWSVVANSAETLIENQSIRVFSVEHGASVGLRFDVLDGARWRTVLSNMAIAKRAPWEKAQQTHLESLDIETVDGGIPQSNAAAFTMIKKVSDDHLMLMGSHGGRAIQMSVQLTGPDQVSVRVSASARPGSGDVQLSHMWSHYYFVPDDRAMGYALPLDFAWLPNLHKNAEDVCGDHFFRSPAVITQGRGLYAALATEVGFTDANCGQLQPAEVDAAAASWKAAQLASVCCKTNRYVSRMSVAFPTKGTPSLCRSGPASRVYRVR
ncbi:MAG: hypothetical protein P8N76_08260 [Pirellulaceae bacterium]|nr:hypothetical protein [Pirellulaceae bacterium]